MPKPSTDTARRGGHPHGPRAHDGTIVAEEPDAMRGTDMTTTIAADQGTVHVFIAVDHCTCECVGLHAAERGDRFEAPEPLRRGVSTVKSPLREPDGDTHGWLTGFEPAISRSTIWRLNR